MIDAAAERIDFSRMVPPDAVGAEPDQRPWSQAETRSYRVFTDQHGRKIGADTEKKTDHPTGPYQFQFKAPLYPNPAYIRIINAALGQLWIDYRQWLLDLEQAHRDWENTLRRIAYERFPTMAAEVIEQGHPMLLREAGPRPQPIQPVLAMSQGEPWILGVPGAQMPAGLARFFPVPEQERERILSWDEEQNAAVAEQQRAGEPPHEPRTGVALQTEDGSPLNFPLYIGGNTFLFSDGVARKLSKDEAVQFQAKLDEGAVTAPAGAGAGW